MSIKKVFKSYIPSVNYVTQRGRTCSFVEGRYETDVPEEIAELNSVCESKSNPHLYIDINEVEIDTTVQERLQAASQKAVLEELERINQEKGIGQGAGEQKVTQNPQTPGNMSAAKMLGVMNSASLGSMTAHSNTK